MWKVLILISSVLLALPAWAGRNETRPPACDAPVQASCAAAVEGVRVLVVNGANSSDCTAGGGTDSNVCIYNGSAWVLDTTSITANSIDWDDITAAMTLDTDTTITQADGLELLLDASYTEGTSEPLRVNLLQEDDADATDAHSGILVQITKDSGDADTLIGLEISNADGAGDTATDAGIYVNNLETTAATMTSGILVESSGVNLGVTTGIDVSHSNIRDGINVGANPIVTGNVAGTIGDATTDSWTLTTDGTGNAELVVPDDSIGATELDGAGVCASMVYAGMDPSEAGATDDYMSFFDHGGSQTQINEDEYQAALVVVHSMNCFVDVDPGGTDTWRITVQDDGVNVTNTTCDIDGGSTSCASAGSDTVAQGSKMNFEIDSSFGTSDPDAAAFLFCSVCFGH
jgi:hypothetical protein